ncbi:alanine racemase [Azorhizobium oxalatiphilum]|uniref:Alanine racemase n=1 Tax=Azorhizobium oxalatiphilum TaxID=980631 RepID=A0A917BUP6_9HYPH|nr:DSD1 family PLP-dependent enzyme [Azorhizobium oxalatiphilum]GGF57490.1 alanine racemase [Azorhizobium oxalatiphilum]
MTIAAALAELPTPCLVLDEARMRANIARLNAHLAPLNVTLRPHLKTLKSVEAARQVLKGGNGPATVSTLKEAEVFAQAGVKDIIYAVGIAPQKLPRVQVLRGAGCDLAVVLDTRAQAEAVAEASRASGEAIPALIEIDCDAHRAGLKPDDAEIVAIGRILVDGGAELRGVLTHSGGSYGAVGAEALADFAEQERAAIVAAAQTLRDAGLPCPVVSVGSTPTAHFARDLTGVTEVRAGVYVAQDLVMAGIGVCKPEDIALSVLGTVIGHQHERGWILVDAGWMAMSRDRGTASQSVDQGYGMVCDVEGNVIPDLIMVAANQEHGIIGLRPGSTATLPELAVGEKLRILPNHACATATEHDGYEVIPANGSTRLAHWPRFRGW